MPETLIMPSACFDPMGAESGMGAETPFYADLGGSSSFAAAGVDAALTYALASLAKPLPDAAPAGDGLIASSANGPGYLTAADLLLEPPEFSYGLLEATDELNPTRPNTYKDDYLLAPEAAGSLQVQVESWDFDAYLQIVDAETGEVLLENDDFQGSLNPQVTFEAEAGSRYLARVTSFSEFDLGGYRFSSQLFPEIIDPDPDPDPDPQPFDPAYGYGLIDAAAAVALALNQAPFDPVADLGGLQWGNDLVNAPDVWAQGFTGEGITVAVIDSGVDIFHEDLLDNIWTNEDEIAGDGLDNDSNGYIDDIYGWNFGEGQYNNDVTPGTNNFGQEHGTHVAGTIAAQDNDLGITGVAYNARIMALRMGDVVDNVFANAGSLAEAIRYAVDNGARVVNMSLGWTDSAELAAALAYAASKDVIAVMSAGNSSLSSPGTPANYAVDYGLSVGAVDINQALADFSNLAGSDSRQQHIVAPGVDIYSTITGDDYDFSSGTSMAAPHVAGVVALMLSANPSLTHSQVRDLLTSTGRPLPAAPGLLLPVDSEEMPEVFAATAAASFSWDGAPAAGLGGERDRAAEPEAAIAAPPPSYQLAALVRSEAVDAPAPPTAQPASPAELLPAAWAGERLSAQLAAWALIA